MEGEEVSKTFPEDLVGKILAMVPFPSIFKARVLSKTWLARFSSISSQDDEEEKCLAASFQRQVCERSINWKTFCPFLMSWGDCIAYDRDSHHWRRMPSLSFLPEHIFNDSDAHMEGALLFTWHWAKGGESEIYVANILTQSWKQLPTPPDMEICLGKKLVSHTSLKMYNVFVFVRQSGGCHLVHIYDSNSNAWSSKKFVASEKYFLHTTPVYLNGFLYMIANQDWRNLLAFNVKELTLEELDDLGCDVNPLACDLVACNSDLIMVTYSGSNSFQDTLMLKLDPGSRKWRKIAQGNPAALNSRASELPFRNRFSRPVSNGDRIFWNANSGVVEYDVHRDKWSSFPYPAKTNDLWNSSPVQVGVNPFEEV